MIRRAGRRPPAAWAWGGRPARGAARNAMINPPLIVRLSCPGAVGKVGQPVAVAVEVRNVSADALWVVGVLDGSEAGVRYPHYRPAISGPAPPEPELFDCGNVAPLRLEDFRRLPPGGGFDPTRPTGGAAFVPLNAFVNFRVTLPGVYQFRLVLSTESADAGAWLGMSGYPGEEEVVARLSLVPRLRIESNVLSIDIS